MLTWNIGFAHSLYCGILFAASNIFTAFSIVRYMPMLVNALVPDYRMVDFDVISNNMVLIIRQMCLPPGQKRRWSVTISSRRGSHDFNSPKVRIPESANIFAYWGPIPSSCCNRWLESSQVLAVIQRARYIELFRLTPSWLCATQSVIPAHLYVITYQMLRWKLTELTSKHT